MRDSFAYKEVSIQSICSRFKVSRQALYEYRKRQKQTKAENEVVLHLVREKRRQLPREGIKKLHRRLQKDFKSLGIKMGRDKLCDLLRTNDLLVKPQRRFVKTTQSKHRFYTYKNLIRDCMPSGPNEVWVSDITYIRVKSKFMYLALITDAYSRKIVGYDISDSLELTGCLSALRMAIKQRGSTQGLIHHSDRGIQYCSRAYTELLAQNEIQISMAQAGNCYENAMAERVNGILKDEFFLNQNFSTKAQATKAVHEAVKLYNEVRLHMNIDYMTPSKKHVA